MSKAEFLWRHLGTLWPVTSMQIILIALVLQRKKNHQVGDGYAFESLKSSKIKEPAPWKGEWHTALGNSHPSEYFVTFLNILVTDKLKQLMELWYGNIILGSWNVLRGKPGIQGYKEGTVRHSHVKLHCLHFLPHEILSPPSSKIDMEMCLQFLQHSLKSYCRETCNCLR